ncbi:hypothetical protein [Photobacterium profundum]|uniref:hypothetical protein n=1 Tax=Photobacterium profundum TaxID=74109 RepID=UPI0002D6D56E|nr:hypothetical protein [Photobacterium profundum]
MKRSILLAASLVILPSLAMANNAHHETNQDSAHMVGMHSEMMQQMMNNPEQMQAMMTEMQQMMKKMGCQGNMTTMMKNSPEQQ